jgi:hypothetical protein
MAFRFLLLILFQPIGFLLAQPLPVSRPPGYDSLRTLGEQFKPGNALAFQGVHILYTPSSIPEEGPLLFSKDSIMAKDPYYTIVGILEGNMPETLQKLGLKAISGFQYKDFHKKKWDDLIIHTVFVLRNDNRSDTTHKNSVYWVVCESKYSPYSSSNFNSFISVPYFEKLKQTYQDKDVILLKDKSRWHCTLVGVGKAQEKDPAFTIHCSLTNEKGKELLLSPPSEKERTFLPVSEYERLDHANRNMKLKMQEEEKESKAAHLDVCVKKFGKVKGELVADGKIETGMYLEMVRVAWGEPWDKEVHNTVFERVESWKYNWNYTLEFKNGMLMNIDH